MDILIFLSGFMVPLTVFYIVGFGILSGRPVFDDFLKGDEDGCGHPSHSDRPYGRSGDFKGVRFPGSRGKSLKDPGRLASYPGPSGPCGPGPPGIQLCGHGADPGYL